LPDNIQSAIEDFKRRHGLRRFSAPMTGGFADLKQALANRSPRDWEPL